MRRGPTRRLLATTLIAVGMAPRLVVAALPPPPQKVILDPGYYGAVTLDHAAHLARRVHCYRCHGPGPVHKLGKFTPARAHEACRGCHVELARGPTDCRSCHVARPSPPAALAAAAGGDGKAGASPEAAPSDASRAASATASAAAARRSVEPPDPFALRRTIHAGVAIVTGDGGGLSAGFAAGVTLRQDGLVMSQVLEWSGGGRRQRALGLLGGGVVIPLRGRVNGEILGVGGFDAAEGSLASMTPTVGARMGLEWFGGTGWLRTIGLSLTGTVDVTRHRDAPGSEARGFVLSACVASGVDRG